MKTIFFGLIFLFLLSCNTKEQASTNKENPSKTAPRETLLKIPEPDADSLFFFVEKQVSFGARVPGSKEHKQCGDWLVKKFQSYGFSVTEQKGTFQSPDGNTYPVRNIIASYKPELKNRLIISAHWDTRPYADEDSVNKDKPILGANDGASGVAVILELARLFPRDLQYGVDFILWDTEDVGKSDIENSYCLGSQYWCKNKHTPGYSADYCINLDMVGSKDPQFPMEEFSRLYASELLNEIWQIAAKLGYGGFFIYYKEGPITDDHYYVNTMAKIPAIDIINRDFNKNTFFPEWHTHGDNLNAVSKETLRMVARTLMYYLKQRNQKLNPA